MVLKVLLKFQSTLVLVHVWLFPVVCNFYTEALFAPFCALWRTCIYALLPSFALFRAHLRVSASDRV